jgi:Fe-S-cluster containining protein
MADEPLPPPHLPRVDGPLPALNPHPQETLDGLRAALRPALHGIHNDHARGLQVEFEQAVIVQAVLQVLMAKGLVTREELDAVYPAMHQMMVDLRARQLSGPRLFPGLGTLAEPSGLDCAAHHPTCGAACCSSFNVLLTPEEAASHKYLWDLAHPYRLLTDDDGTCVYFDRARLGCSIWQDRPSACRAFDCRKDDRVWQDYPNRGLTEAAMAAKARLAAARAREAAGKDAPPGGSGSAPG